MYIIIKSRSINNFSDQELMCYLLLLWEQTVPWHVITSKSGLCKPRIGAGYESRLLGRYASSFHIQITQIQNYPNTNGEKGIKWLNRAQRKTASNQSFLALRPLFTFLRFVSFSPPYFVCFVPFRREVSCQTREQLHSWSCISGTCLSRTAAFDFWV